MKVSEIMTRDVLTVGPDTPVAAAAALMVEKRISGLPVVDADGTVLGMFTEGDLLHRAETGTEGKHHSGFMNFLLGYGRSAEEYVEAYSRRVGDLMTEGAVWVGEDASLQDAVDLMARKKIRRVAVLRDGKLAGMLSRADLVRALAAKLAPTESLQTDAEIREKLTAELEAQPWVHAANISVDVKDRVVTLEGLVFDERVRRAVVVAASNVAQGTKVEDHLMWADPSCGLVLGA